MSATITNGRETLKLCDCVDCFAVPGAGNIVDLVHPLTDRSIYANETLAQVRLRYPGAVQMRVDDWQKAKAAQQDTPIAWCEISSERFNDWFECLPPMAYGAGGSFLVGEPSDHHAVTGAPRYQACRQVGTRCEASSRPITVKEFRTLFPRMTERGN